MSHPHITHQDDLSWVEHQSGEAFSAMRKQLGAAAGGQELGCSLLRLEPGKRAWPFHFHYGNEEAIYILEGKGTMRLGDSLEEVRAGHYIAMPADPNLAHQLINTSKEPLVYLCISTMCSPEVCGYPDSGKVGVIAGSAPGGDPEKRIETAFFPQDAAVDYWKGETE